MPPQDNRFLALLARREVALVCLVILSFVAINFTVAVRTPTVFVDEPPYADPAANFYLGSGFTSTMWGQDPHDFWTGNVPLYQIFLAGFFKLFGFGLFQARAVNTLLAALAGGMIWRAVRRLDLIKTAPYRLLGLVLVLSGSVSTLTIRTIRPDTTMFAVCAALFLAWTVRSDKLRLPAVFLCGSLLPLAGLPMLIYVPIMLGLYVLICGFCYIGTVAAALLGLAGGIGWLGLFYGHFSSIGNFIDTVLPFTSISPGGPSLTDKLALKLFGDHQLVPESIFTSFFGAPLEFESQKTLFDYSAALLFALVIGLAIANRSHLQKEQKKVLWLAVLLVLIVPPCLHLAAHYRSMYRWMTYMPLCVLAPCLTESVLRNSGQLMMRRIVAGIFLIAVLLGVPLRTIFIIPGWSERSVGPIDSAAARVVKKNDVVICDFKIYFAVRPRAKMVFATGLTARGAFENIKNLPTSEVTLLGLKPGELDTVTKIVGGNWQRVSSGTSGQENDLARTRYAVDFYRRVDQPNSRHP